MKNCIILLSVIALLGACSSGNANKFAEFYVEDVSKAQTFIDSTSGTAGKLALMGGNEVMKVSLEGELDSSADVSLRYYPSDQLITEFNLKKEDNLVLKQNGTIPYIEMMFDYYGGDTLLIRYIPKGATKGHLKIRTNIL
jgi:hypothetical protein